MRSCSKSRSSSTIRSRQGFGSIEASVSNPTVGCKAITPIPSAGRRAAAASPAPTRRGSYTPAPAPGPAPAGGGSPHHRPPRRQPARRRTPAAAGAAAAPRRSTGPRPPSPAPPARDRPRPGTRRRSPPRPPPPPREIARGRVLGGDPLQFHPEPPAGGHHTAVHVRLDGRGAVVGPAHPLHGGPPGLQDEGDAPAPHVDDVLVQRLP